MLLGNGQSRVFQCFTDVEREVHTFTLQMLAFVAFSSSICLLLPLITAGASYFFGTYTDSDLWLPYQFM